MVAAGAVDGGGQIVSWADRIAYCAHDLEDAIYAGIVEVGDIPEVVRGSRA